MLTQEWAYADTWYSDEAHGAIFTDSTPALAAIRGDDLLWPAV